MTVPVRKILIRPDVVAVRNTDLHYAVKNIHNVTEEVDLLFVYRKQNRKNDPRYRAVTANIHPETGHLFLAYYCLGDLTHPYNLNITPGGVIDPTYNMLFRVVNPFKAWIEDEYQKGNLVEGSSYQHKQYGVEIASAAEHNLISSNALVQCPDFDSAPRY